MISPFFFFDPETLLHTVGPNLGRSSSNQTHGPEAKAIKFQIQQSKLVV